MLRFDDVVTIAAATAEQAVAHGLALALDAVAVRACTITATWNAFLSTSAEAQGHDTTNVYVAALNADTRAQVLAVVWQGRSY